MDAAFPEPDSRIVSTDGAAPPPELIELPTPGPSRAMRRNVWITDPFEVEKPVWLVVDVRVAGVPGPVQVRLVSGRGRSRMLKAWPGAREPGGERRLAFSALLEAGSYRLSLRTRADDRFRVLSTDLHQHAYDPLVPEATDTTLPHWNRLQRTIHALCKRSRLFNEFVASVEMRLNRIEVLSLPRLFSVCPTGQCNATCAFCSVTINRTGIIKRQMNHRTFRGFVAPFARTVATFGIEGNGEPTLYREFDDLVLNLSKGAHNYLITNGSRIKQEQIPLLLSFGDINFSLNAATAETHRRVMGLKNFDEILATIRALKVARDAFLTPQLSVSMVVDADSIHEATDFLRLAERDLGVDVVWLRTLSELGTDLGNMQDARDIVPYDSDIEDMIEDVREYLALAPRTEATRIEFKPDTFKATRPDPIGRVPHPRGFAHALLSPRASGYVQESAGEVAWGYRTLSLACPAGDDRRTVLRSVPIFVERGREHLFWAEVQIAHGLLRVTVVAEDGSSLASASCRSGVHDLRLAFDTGAHETVRLSWETDRDGCAARVAFPRQYKPVATIRRKFRLPHARRWQIEMPAAELVWPSASRLSIKSSGPRWLYVAKSFDVPCEPDSVLAITPAVQVLAGELGLGVLDEAKNGWLVTRSFAFGEHQEPITFLTRSNRSVCVALYANTDDPVHAEIDWGDSIDPLPQKFEAELRLGRALAPTTEAASAGSGPADAGKAGAGGPKPEVRPKRVTKRIRYVCQKPWTDLANFTVDGRLDVCCIATGASQERYALGNLGSSSFQDVWNGPQIQEFRRTVHSDTPLPCCQRCPMYFQHAGPFFDKNVAYSLVDAVLARLGLTRGSKAHRYLGGIARQCIDRTLFRGFR